MRDLTRILEEATRRVPKEYFQLPVAGQEDPVYRERVYCYELYHHVRSLWPESTDYSLCGEADKAGHRLIRGDNLDKTKPDFWVHVPGRMDNELVMEVKPINAQKNGVEKDLQTLTAYRRYAEYRRAILLVYGGATDDFYQFKEVLEAIAAQDTGDSIDLGLLELWYHPAPGEAAVSVEW